MMTADQAAAGELNSGGVGDDDSFLDWETRHESFPFHKHIVAGRIIDVD
jgi:hypothetical protein